MSPIGASGTDAGEVDAELLGGPQEVVVLVAHLGAGALLGDDVDVLHRRAVEHRRRDVDAAVVVVDRHGRSARCPELLPITQNA
jgi:hypothetical protein